MSVRNTLLALFVILPAAGCGSTFTFEQQFEIAPGSTAQIYTIDAPTSNQKVRVSVTATAAVNVVVMLTDDYDSSAEVAVEVATSPRKHSVRS